MKFPAFCSMRSAQHRGKSDIRGASRRHADEAGFTLIEMIAVMGIIGVVSTIVFANNGRFGGQVILQNLAYDIALSIREAQVYGISVRRFDQADDVQTYATAYGMHFGSAQAYELFADVIDDGIYSDSGELVEETSILSGYSISKLCTTVSNCADTEGVSRLDIAFRRPESDAWISTSGAVCTPDPAYIDNCEERACIVVRSPRGDTKSIVIEVNGQIAVQNSCL